VDAALRLRTSPTRFSWKLALILGAGILAFAVTLTVICLEELRSREERLATLDAQVRFAVIAVDTKLEIELQQLRDLAMSDRLRLRQFPEFYREARVFAERNRRQVVLLDVHRNTQIFNTAYEMNARLQEGARFLQKESVDSLRPDQPYISQLFYAPLAQRRMVAVAVPISEGDSVQYLLGVAIDPVEILAAIKEGTFAPDTITLIVDRTGIVLARTAENDKYMGRAAPRNVAERA
jgi:hypothetical protein